MHNQMEVIANNMTAILDLANRQIRTGHHLRRLQTFINLQFFACMWGIVPVSRTRIARSTNAPMLTWRLPGPSHPSASDLGRSCGGRSASRQDRARDAGQWRIVCRYSDEPFNTAEIIGPHWREIPGHLPSVAMFLSLTLVIISCGWMAARGRYKGSQDECTS
jgi:hypothetical protein